AGRRSGERRISDVETVRWVDGPRTTGVDGLEADVDRGTIVQRQIADRLSRRHAHLDLIVLREVGAGNDLVLGAEEALLEDEDPRCDRLRRPARHGRPRRT